MCTWQNGTVQKKLLLATAAIAHAIGSQFGKFLPGFYAYLEMTLNSFGEYQVFPMSSVNVGVICDIVHALVWSDTVSPYYDKIVEHLLRNVASNILNCSVNILSFWRDIYLSFQRTLRDMLAI